MNKRLVARVLGEITLIEAACMLPALLIALVNRQGDAKSLAISIAVMLLFGLPILALVRPNERNLRAKDGFAVVAMAWVLLSLFGALPLRLSGLFDNYVDAVFESVSGFTTTGATVLTRFEGAPKGIMFWRSFTHWIGGMGVLVLTLALLPQMTGRTSHLVRAESPGPSLSKIVPKMGDSAKILYLIYGALTLLEFLALLLAGMSPYDAAIHAVGTAGTGGFSNYGQSVAAFHSTAVDVIITVFMILFGVNFALFYHLLIGDWRTALGSEELHWYLCILAAGILFVTGFITPVYGSFLKALRYGSFQVASVISTTGFATADFNRWPEMVRMMLFLLMFLGGCAGSTAGGLKVVRVALLCKQGLRDVRRTFQPRRVQVIHFEGKGVDDGMLAQVGAYFFVFIALTLLGALAISLEGKFDFETNLTAAVTCMNNVGPGLGIVGPAGGFSTYGPLAKIVCSLLMLCGRLELFPILVIFHPAIWRKV